MRKVILALVPFVFATPALAMEGSVLPVNPAATSAFAAADAGPFAQPRIRTRMTRDAAIGQYDSMIAAHAAANGIPESLVRRIIKRESGGRAGAVSRGNYGLMQIKLATARGLGYTGSAAGLLNPETNMTYAVKYLAGAYRAAHGNESRAVGYYASGYYYAAKRQGMTASTSATFATPGTMAAATAEPRTFTAATERAMGEATPALVAMSDTSFAMSPAHRHHRHKRI